MGPPIVWSVLLVGGEFTLELTCLFVILQALTLQCALNWREFSFPVDLFIVQVSNACIRTILVVFY